MIVRGMSFCQVLKIRQGSHLSLAITLGNQKWRGAAPNFSSRLVVIRRRGITLFVKGDALEINSILNNSRAEPIAWARKYLIAASVSCWVLLIDIRGIKDIRFSSKAVQIRSQWEEDKAIIVLDTKVKEKIAENGKKERINT